MDPSKAKSRAAHKHEGAYYAAALDRKRGRLYAGSTDYAIHLFDVPRDQPPADAAAAKSDGQKPSGKQPDAKTNGPKAKTSGPAAAKFEPIARWTKHDNYVSALAFVEQAGALVSGGYDGKLIWWDAAQGTGSGVAKTSVAGHHGWVRALRATPDGSLVISAGDDMLIKCWDAATGKPVRTLEGHAKTTPQHFVTALYALAVSSDGKYLASADRIGAVRVWEIATGQTVQQFDVPILYTWDPRQRKRSIGGIRAAAFSPDGKRLAVGGIGQVGNVDGFEGPAHVEVWDWQKPQKLFATGLEGQKGIINHLAFDPSGTWLIGAGGGNGGLLGFWKVKPLPQPVGDKPKEGGKPKEGQSKAGDKPQPGKKPKEAKEPDVPVQRVKFDGHIHDFHLNAEATELYAAGHGKLEVWDLRG